MIVRTVLTAVVSALVWPLMFTPPATIYRSLAPGGATVAAEFS
jgi:hypothetical protein